MTPKKSRLSPGVWTVLCLLLALCLWEWAAAAGHVNDYFFSRPSALWAEFLELVSSGLLAKHLSVTLQEAGLGLLFGGLFGTLAGLGLGLAPRVSRALTPLLTGLNGLPKLALGPVFIIWFGLGLRSKVIMSALMVFFIFVFNLYICSCIFGINDLISYCNVHLNFLTIYCSTGSDSNNFCLLWFFF